MTFNPRFGPDDAVKKGLLSAFATYYPRYRREIDLARDNSLKNVLAIHKEFRKAYEIAERRCAVDFHIPSRPASPDAPDLAQYMPVRRDAYDRYLRPDFEAFDESNMRTTYVQNPDRVINAYKRLKTVPELHGVADRMRADIQKIRESTAEEAKFFESKFPIIARLLDVDRHKLHGLEGDELTSFMNSVRQKLSYIWQIEKKWNLVKSKKPTITWNDFESWFSFILVPPSLSTAKAQEAFDLVRTSLGIPKPNHRVALLQAVAPAKRTYAHRLVIDRRAAQMASGRPPDISDLTDFDADDSIAEGCLTITRRDYQIDLADREFVVSDFASDDDVAKHLIAANPDGCFLVAPAGKEGDWTCEPFERQLEICAKVGCQVLGAVIDTTHPDDADDSLHDAGELKRCLRQAGLDDSIEVGECDCLHIANEEFADSPSSYWGAKAFELDMAQPWCRMREEPRQTILLTRNAECIDDEGVQVDVVRGVLNRGDELKVVDNGKSRSLKVDKIRFVQQDVDWADKDIQPVVLQFAGSGNGSLAKDVFLVAASRAEPRKLFSAFIYLLAKHEGGSLMRSIASHERVDFKLFGKLMAGTLAADGENDPCPLGATLRAKVGLGENVPFFKGARFDILLDSRIVGCGIMAD